MHALRRLTPVLEHALVHLDATLFIFGLIFKISAIIYTYTIEKTKKTMHTEFIIISILIIALFIYTIYEVAKVLLHQDKYKGHDTLIQFCQLDAICVLLDIILLIFSKAISSANSQFGMFFVMQLLITLTIHTIAACMSMDYDSEH